MNDTPRIEHPASVVIEDTLDAVRALAQIRTMVNALYPYLLGEAHQQGHTLQSVGDAADIHRSTVHNIVKGRAS